MKAKPMNNIHNVDELRAEISRLKELSGQQEQLLRNDVKLVREDLRPVNLASSMFTHITGIRIDKNDLLKNGLALGVSLLIRKILMRAENNAEQKVYEFVDGLGSKIKDFFRSKKHTEHSAGEGSGAES